MIISPLFQPSDPKDTHLPCKNSKPRNSQHQPKIFCPLASSKIGHIGSKLRAAKYLSSPIAKDRQEKCNQRRSRSLKPPFLNIWQKSPISPFTYPTCSAFDRLSLCLQCKRLEAPRAFRRKESYQSLFKISPQALWWLSSHWSSSFSRKAPYKLRKSWKLGIKFRICDIYLFLPFRSWWIECFCWWGLGAALQQWRRPSSASYCKFKFSSCCFLTR